jgi:hypothetical protein
MRTSKRAKQMAKEFHRGTESDKYRVIYDLHQMTTDLAIGVTAYMIAEYLDEDDVSSFISGIEDFY